MAQMASARWPPARPACCHSHRGNLALQLPQFSSGVMALFAGPWGRGLLPSPVELEPKSPTRSLLEQHSSPSRALAGWQAARRASQTHTGSGPVPRALAPCHRPLVALSPPLMPICSCSSSPCSGWAHCWCLPPQGLGSSSAAASIHFDEEETPAGTACVCF